MRFEWVKWKRNPKNRLVLGILLLFVGVLLVEQWDSSTQADKLDYKVLRAMAEEIQPPQGYTGTPYSSRCCIILMSKAFFLSEKG